MRKIVLFLAGVLLFASCSNVEQYKEAINTLSTNWDNATSTVTSLLDEIKAETGACQEAIAGMEVTEETKEKMNEEATQAMADLVQTSNAQCSAVSTLGEEVTAFATTWGEKAEKLNGLKEGLESGSLPTDVQTTIDELSTAITEATEKAGGWKEALNTAKTTLAEATKKATEMLAELSDSEAGGN